jgi:hypothetical protein
LRPAVAAAQVRLGELPKLSRDELVRRWESIYGSAPPKNLKRPLIERALAWHIQAKVLGGLSEKAKRVLERVQSQTVASRGFVGGEGGVSVPAAAPSHATPPLSEGTRLVRDWRGRTHVVDVTGKGLRWNGEEYRSLSAIARKITGARWSGPRFFGL